MNMMTRIARRRLYVPQLAYHPDFQIPLRGRWMMDRSDPDFELSHPDVIDQRRLETLDGWRTTEDDEEDDDDTGVDDGPMHALAEDGI